MKNITKHLLIAAIGLSSISFQGCNGNKKDAQTTDTTITDTPTSAPVEISKDEELKTKAADATKDFPGVTATVASGEVTLTGEIRRDRLQTLMQSINAIQAKKINNNLKIND